MFAAKDSIRQQKRTHTHTLLLLLCVCVLLLLCVCVCVCVCVFAPVHLLHSPIISVYSVPYFNLLTSLILSRLVKILYIVFKIETSS